jgi:hypothetical protein
MHLRIKKILLIGVVLIQQVFFTPLELRFARAEVFSEFELENLTTISTETVTLVQTSTKIFTPDNLFEYINGQAEQYLAYGFSSLKTAEYTDLPQKSLHVALEIYRMSDPLAAFGIYSAGRFEGVQYTEHGTEGFLSVPMLVFFKGDYYVKISCFTQNPQRQRVALEQLGKIIDEKIPGDEKYPSEINSLVEVGIDPQIVSYSEKGLFGYDFLPSGFQIKHTLRGETFSFFASVCSDTFQAQDFLRAYIGAMRIENRAIQERIWESVKMWEVEDPYNGKVLILVNKNILAGMKNLPENPEAGLKILKRIVFKGL